MYSYFSRFVLNSPGGFTANNSNALLGVFQIKGILNFRVFKTENNVIKTGFQFYPVEVTYRGERQKLVEEVFSRMFFAFFSREGRLISFEFPDSIAEKDRRSISDAVKILQVVIPRAAAGSWDTIESDKYGTYFSEYKFNYKPVKHKKKYSEITDKDITEAVKMIDVKKSDTEFEYGAPDTWLRKMNSDELSVFYDDGKRVIMKLSSTIELETIPFNPDNSLAIWKNDIDGEAVIADWKSRPVERLSVNEKNNILKIEKHYGSLDFKIVMNRLLKKYNKFSRQCVREIVDYLKLFPEAASMIPDVLLEDIGKEQRAMLVNALQSDKSEYSQNALMEIVNGSEFPPDSRVQSAVAAGDIDSPADGIIDRLISSYENRNESGLSVKISDSSILSLGRISGKLSNRNDSDYESEVAKINNKIFSEFSETEDNGRLSSVIYAAGNTCDNDFIGPVSKCLNSGSSMVRSAAAISLSAFNDSGINEILTGRLKNEENVNVRCSIIKSLYSRKSDQAVIEKICNEVQAEDNAMVRNSMYRYLMKNRKEPGVKKVLSAMLLQENSPENRDIISRALASRK